MVAATTPDPGAARRSGLRWVGAGLADQLVMASANAGNTLLALILLDRRRAGIMLLSLGIAYVVMSVNRAFVGDVLLAMASRMEGQRRDRLVRDGLASAVCIGVAASLVALVVWAVAPHEPDIDLRDLIWLGPFLPMILLHDTGRYTYLSARESGKALQIDLVWVSTQGLTVAVLYLLHAATAGGLLAAWGIGATVGGTFFLVRTKARPWLGRPRRWATQTRRLSGWFTATTLIGQFQVQAVGFLVAWRLTARELSGLRGAQTVLLQPVQNLILAMFGLLVPRASRLARDAARLPEPAAGAAAAALRRQTRLLALLFGGMGLLLTLVLWPLAHFVLVHIHKFADIAPLALPMSIQAGIYLLQMPFTAAMRGMHRARMLFAQYAIFTTTSLTGLVVGANVDRLTGAAWGLTIGASVGLAAMIGLYEYALRWLGDAEPDDITDSDGFTIVKPVSVSR